MRKYEPQRRVINIKPEVHESQISFVVKDASSYDKSVEVPSSFLEPSIVFDEKEGKSGPAMINHVARYKFKPIFARQGGMPSIMENKLTEGTQIMPKDNDSESLIACSMSDFLCSDKSNLNSFSFIGQQEIIGEKELSNILEKEQPKKEEVKRKRKLKDYITQVDENADFIDLLKPSPSKSKLKNKHVKHDSKVRVELSSF